MPSFPGFLLRLLIAVPMLPGAAALAAGALRTPTATLDTRSAVRAASVAPSPAGAKAALAAVIEFYDAARDHYFITSDAHEIADLDHGIHAGWQRTGWSFGAYAAPAVGTSAVCRFYIPPQLGDSHFFSASTTECAQTRARFPGFTLEAQDAFDVALPDPVTGACPASTVAIYRLWNGRRDTNHRYTPDRSVWEQMTSQGWTAEGYGPAQVALCAPPTALAPVDVAVQGRAVIKARAGGSVVALLEERLTSLLEDGPDRIVALLQPDGRTTRALSPPAGWSLTDLAVHPSGDVSLVLTTTTAVRLLRLDPSGQVRADQAFADPAAARDPYIAFDTAPKNDDALQPTLMHDAARIVPLGESVALVLRTGRNAVVAYRLDQDASGGYTTAWRTLVEPGSSLDGVGLSSGSFDTFGQLVDHVGVHIDLDARGTLAVALVEWPFRSYVFAAHAAYFGEPVAAQSGVLVTRVDTADGRRLGSTVIDTQQPSELHGLRATDGGFVLTGRVRTAVRPDGGGWDAWFGAMANGGNVQAYRVVDVDRGDVLFDAVGLADGRYIALGTTGYVQNPSGASISEDAQPLLTLLDHDGMLLQRVSLPDGPRQDQLRSIVAFDGRWLVGGMRNGPGTHSGDGQPQLISADGYLKEMSELPTP